MTTSLDPSTLFAAPLPPTSLANRTNGTSTTTSQPRAAKPTAATAPRVDLEPVYSALKSAIPEYWLEYKEAVALFALGKLNIHEVAHRVDHFLDDPHIEHLHNQLMVGLIANTSREPPESGVAPWVSANDKPTASLSKSAAGNEAERRLKNEVMQLPARERRRIKDIPEPEFRNPVPRSITAYRDAWKLQPPQDVTPASAGGLNRTSNWELEIRKRYNAPLAAETGEFPDADAVAARMVPICYEEALPNGANTACAGFLATATEFFVKEVLSNFYSRTRVNMPGGSVHGPLTHRFKMQLQWEEDAVGRGDLSRIGGPSGLLPVEAREAATRRPVGVADMKLALRTGDSSLGLFPFVRAGVSESRPEGEYEEYQALREERAKELKDEAEREAMRRKLLEASRKNEGMDWDVEMVNGFHEDQPADRVNGVNGIATTNGFVPHYEENDDFGWEGGSKHSRNELAAALDEVLNF